MRYIHSIITFSFWLGGIADLTKLLNDLRVSIKVRVQNRFQLQI